MSATTLNIPANNPIELNEKKKALEVLAKLDQDSLEKLKTLAKDPIKAKQKLDSKWSLIKAFF